MKKKKLKIKIKKGHISKPDDWKKIPDRTVEKGVKVEYEHTKNYKTARRIMADHVIETCPAYYEELEKMEKRLEKRKGCKGWHSK